MTFPASVAESREGSGESRPIAFLPFNGKTFFLRQYETAQPDAKCNVLSVAADQLEALIGALCTIAREQRGAPESLHAVHVVQATTSDQGQVVYLRQYRDSKDLTKPDVIGVDEKDFDEFVAELVEIRNTRRLRGREREMAERRATKKKFSKTAAAREASALAKACPSCGAKPGKYCRSSKGQVAAFHQGRV